MAIRGEPLSDQDYSRRYMEALLLKHGLKTIPESQALKDRGEFPGLSPEAAAAQRSQLHWDGLMDSDDAEVALPVEEPVIAAQPAENSAGNLRTPQSAAVAPAPPVRHRPAAILPVVPMTQYDVGGKIFTDLGEAILYAYAVEMENVTGMPMDLDMLKTNARRIMALTADYLNRTTED